VRVTKHARWQLGGNRFQGIWRAGVGRSQAVRAEPRVERQEPFPLLVKENFNVIRRINAQGISVFLVEQNVRQTLAICHFGYVLAKGRVVASGRPDELADRPEVREAYFG
jgi:ABC-type lipopolysaccharide export system ATPase subunit